MAKYFNYESDPMLACPHCGKKGMNDSFLDDVLDPLREACGFPFIITSGYRCPEYNNQISSTGLKGAHTTGLAVDIKANSRQKFIISKEAAKLGMSRFGMGRNFIHIDDCAELERFDEDVIWTY